MCPSLESLHNPSELFRDLLESNREPGDSEFKQVQSKLELASAELQAFSSHIDFLQESLDRLKLERARHQEAIRLHQSVISVIRRLPNDILSLIFFKCIEDGIENVDIMHGTWPFLCSVSQVSQRWRAVALSTPSLWANICVSEHEYNSSLTSVISMCLSRARDSPLHIFIQRPCDYSVLGDASSAGSAIVQKAFENLCSKALHWKRLKLYVNNRSFLNTVRSLSAAPMLEHLTIYLSKDDASEPISFILNAPALRHVYLIQNVVPCPWEQLTSLRYIACVTTLTSFVDILPRLSQLRELDMSSDTAIDLARSQTVLPNLRALTLQRKCPRGLQYLVLPALVDLTLLFIHWTDSGLLTMLEASRRSLKRFELQEWSPNIFDSKSFRRLSEASPTLEEVTLVILRSKGPYMREMISHLICHADTEVLFPSLRLIDISRSEYQQWPEEDILLTMVESRAAHRKGFVAYLPSTATIDDAVKQRVDEIQKKGCTLTIRSLCS